MNQSIMDFNEQNTNHYEKLVEEYEQAVKNGFEGTITEYLTYRDYT